MRTTHLPIALLAALLASTARAADPAVLRSAGLTPLSPQAAAEISLPDLAGVTHALSDHRGRWVLLTFFATWCGPCAQEMPSLQALHEARGGAGLDVLGVSTDRSAAPLPRFLGRFGVSFPVLHDQSGRVASAWQATAIPLSYLIDPAGQVVAISRGAKDWTKFIPAFDALGDPVTPGASPAGTTSAGAPNAAGASAGTPAVPMVEVAPPTAQVTVSTPTPEVGEPFILAVSIQWKGDLSDYTLHPPTVGIPEGLEARATTASSSSTDGHQELTYHLGVVGLETGSFALDPVQIPFTPHGAALQTAQVTGPIVSVASATWAGLPPAAWVGGGVALAAGLGLAPLVLQRRRRAPAAPDPSKERRERLDAARACRLEGDAAGFLVIIRPLLHELDATPAGLPLERWEERARYAGQPPPKRDLDHLERLATRALRAATEDTP